MAILEEKVAKVEGRIDEQSKIFDLLIEEVRRIHDRIDSLIKWQLGMWITTMLAILGLYATIIFKG